MSAVGRRRGNRGSNQFRVPGSGGNGDPNRDFTDNPATDV